MRAPSYEANNSHEIWRHSVRQAACVPYEHKRHPMWLGCGPAALASHGKGWLVFPMSERERERERDDGRAALRFPPLPIPLIPISSAILFQNPAIGTRRATRRSRSGASLRRASGNSSGPPSVIIFLVFSLIMFNR
ncbi:hypothetical protein B296_00049756 [Ensete ventricosum]|uniref:Uncharacterized protein n=1 Tax=Ensete ventricosum TaxID=4639 RepID=A0A426XRW7_ENSVE|nr:hypothetical protein B296_00049756 [Ensete ventricosum]